MIAASGTRKRPLMSIFMSQNFHKPLPLKLYLLGPDKYPKIGVIGRREIVL